jgi:hypothetical protein
MPHPPGIALVYYQGTRGNRGVDVYCCPTLRLLYLLSYVKYCTQEHTHALMPMPLLQTQAGRPGKDGFQPKYTHLPLAMLSVSLSFYLAQHALFES